VDFTERLKELLSRDPSPHRTRRIRKRAVSHGFEIGCGAWRAAFGVEGETVTVTALETGYPLRFLTREGYEAVPDREAQMAFLARWPEVA
jgi:tRNA (adenine37-N6)-methyltransferase